MNIKEVNLIIEKIVGILAAKYNPEKIILFGSYAWGTYTEESDIDILIIKETDKKRRADRFVEVQSLIYSHGIKIPVSPLILTKEEWQERLNLGDDFIEEITTKGKVLHER